MRDLTQCTLDTINTFPYLDKVKYEDIALMVLADADGYRNYVVTKNTDKLIGSQYVDANRTYVNDLLDGIKFTWELTPNDDGIDTATILERLSYLYHIEDLGILQIEALFINDPAVNVDWDRDKDKGVFTIEVKCNDSIASGKTDITVTPADVTMLPWNFYLDGALNIPAHTPIITVQDDPSFVAPDSIDLYFHKFSDEYDIYHCAINRKGNVCTYSTDKDINAPSTMYVNVTTVLDAFITNLAFNISRIGSMGITSIDKYFDLYKTIHLYENIDLSKVTYMTDDYFHNFNNYVYPRNKTYVADDSSFWWPKGLSEYIGLYMTLTAKYPRGSTIKLNVLKGTPIREDLLNNGFLRGIDYQSSEICSVSGTHVGNSIDWISAYGARDDAIFYGTPTDYIYADIYPFNPNMKNFYSVNDMMHFIIPTNSQHLLTTTLDYSIFPYQSARSVRIIQGLVGQQHSYRQTIQFGKFFYKYNKLTDIYIDDVDIFDFNSAHPFSYVNRLGSMRGTLNLTEQVDVDMGNESLPVLNLGVNNILELTMIISPANGYKLTYKNSLFKNVDEGTSIKFFTVWDNARIRIETDVFKGKKLIKGSTSIGMDHIISFTKDYDFPFYDAKVESNFYSNLFRSITVTSKVTSLDLTKLKIDSYPTSNTAIDLTEMFSNSIDNCGFFDDVNCVTVLQFLTRLHTDSPSSQLILDKMFSKCIWISGKAMPIVNYINSLTSVTHDKMFEGCTQLDDYKDIPANFK